MWAVLQYGRGGISYTFQGFVAKWGHGKVDFAFVVVSAEVDLDIFAAGVIDRDIIMFFEGVNEVVGIIARGVLDPKIVDN
mgnify:CR=1 FL=1